MNSKKKGNSFEREISKKLSLWFSNKERDDLFWRSQNSGGRFTSRKKIGKNTKNQSGDITSTDSRGEIFINMFSIECKSYKQVDKWDLFLFKGLIKEWWEKLKYESEDKNCLLIIKENRKPIIIISCLKIMNILQMTPMIVFGDSLELGVYSFDKFIKEVDPNIIEKMEK